MASPGDPGTAAAARHRTSGHAPPRRLARRLVLAVFGLAAVPACGEPFGVQDVLGIWNTESIGGHAVPGIVLYLDRSHDTEYVRWVFYDGGLCTLTQRVESSTETYDQCTYTVNAADETISIVFRFELWDGSVAGHRMTLTDPQDVVWVLRAQ